LLPTFQVLFISHVYSNFSCVIFLQRLFFGGLGLGLGLGTAGLGLGLGLEGAGLGLGLGLETTGLGLGLGTLVLTTRLLFSSVDCGLSAYICQHSFTIAVHRRQYLYLLSGWLHNFKIRLAYSVLLFCDIVVGACYAR